MKILPLAASMSARDSPLPRGFAPTRKAASAPSKAFVASSVTSMELTSGRAESASSMAVPSAARTASGISSRVRSTGSSPNTSPAAMRHSRE